MREGGANNELSLSESFQELNKKPYREAKLMKKQDSLVLLEHIASTPPKQYPSAFLNSIDRVSEPRLYINTRGLAYTKRLV